MLVMFRKDERVSGMAKITRTEAATVMATDVRVWARTHQMQITRTMVEERISEWSGLAGEGTYKGACAKIAKVTTTLRLAVKHATW